MRDAIMVAGVRRDKPKKRTRQQDNISRDYVSYIYNVYIYIYAYIYYIYYICIYIYAYIHVYIVHVNTLIYMTLHGLSNEYTTLNKFS
jgi:hypothetical protein